MSNSSTKVDARPQSPAVDPLTAGLRLHNESNSSDASGYESSVNEVDAIKVAPQNTQVQGSVSSKPAHKVPNKSKLEQDEVAKGRIEQV